MKKITALILVLFVSAFLACGGGGGSQTKAKGEAKNVAEFLDDIIQKGDLPAALEKLHSADKAMLGMMPGFYDFVTGKESEEVPEDMLLARAAINEMVPIPDNILRYEIGEAKGDGDTLMVPVTFYYPTEDLEGLAEKYVDEDLRVQLEDLDQSDLPFEEKKKLVYKAIGQLKDGIKGEKFEMESNEVEVPLVKEDGKWKISIMAGGMMNMFGGGM